MSYLLYVALFGTAATIFLWLRDARIFFRTGLPGYRTGCLLGYRVWRACDPRSSGGILCPRF